MKSTHLHAEHSGHAHDDVHSSANTDKDPVCGMTVKPDSPHRATHAEREYRFCSASCRDKFKRDPQKYLAPKTDQAAAEQGSADSAPPPGITPDFRRAPFAESSLPQRVFTHAIYTPVLIV